jgi:hypothetical protein
MNMVPDYGPGNPNEPARPLEVSDDSEIGDVSKNSLRKDIVGTTKAIVAYTVLYSLLLTVGAIATDGRNLRRFGRSLPATIAFHLAAGLIVGIAAGGFRRWVKSRVGGALLGFLTGIPVFLAVGLFFRPEAPWSVLLPATLTSSLVLGAPIGWMLADVVVDH